MILRWSCSPTSESGTGLREDKLYCAAGPLYEIAWRPEHVASLARLDAGGEKDDASGPLFFILQSTLEIPARQVERLAGGPAAERAPEPQPRTVWSRLAGLFPRPWRRPR